jgi:hypothetical protein
MSTVLEPNNSDILYQIKGRSLLFETFLLDRSTSDEEPIRSPQTFHSLGMGLKQGLCPKGIILELADFSSRKPSSD